MKERFWGWVADRLPRRLVYFAAIRMGAEVTTGKYGQTVVPELLFMDALKRWESGGGPSAVTGEPARNAAA